MRIGICLLGIRFGGGGIPTYVENLVDALSNIDQKNEYIIFIHAAFLSQFKLKQPGFTFEICPIPQQQIKKTFLWQNTSLVSVIKRHKIDVMHYPGNLAPFFSPVPTVVTLHDVIPFYPDMVPFRFPFREITKIVIANAAKKARKVITGSKTAKQEILKFMPVDEKKIEVIYHGIPKSVLKTETAISFQPLTPYILWTGRMVAYKNILHLIQAYHLLVQQKHIPHHLYLVGIPGDTYQSACRLVNTLKMEHRIHFILDIPNEHIQSYYQNASLFVFPSLVEGFGLPLLEAMASGVPIVSSNIAVLKEIALDAACFVNPYDYRDVAEGMWRVLENRDFKRQLIQNGKKRLESFSWEMSAQKTLKVYQGL